MRDRTATVKKTATLPAPTVIDPVCGMAINPAHAAQTRDGDGKTVYLCSNDCALQFDRDPHHYLLGKTAEELDLAPPHPGVVSHASVDAFEARSDDNLAPAIPVDFLVGQAHPESSNTQVADPAAPKGLPTGTADEETAAHQREYQHLMRKFWFAAAISIPVMLVAYPELRWFYLPYLFVAEVPANIIWLLFVLSAIVTLPVMFYSGRQFFTGAWTDCPGHQRGLALLHCSLDGATTLPSRYGVALLRCDRGGDGAGGAGAGVGSTREGPDQSGYPQADQPTGKDSTRRTQRPRSGNSH